MAINTGRQAQGYRRQEGKPETHQGKNDHIGNGEKPLGKALSAVLGFRLSISASISRLAAMAKLLAPTIARVIHKMFSYPAHSSQRERPEICKRKRKDAVLKLYHLKVNFDFIQGRTLSTAGQRVS